MKHLSAFGILFAVFLFGILSSKSAPEGKLEERAGIIIALCAEANYRPSCYEREILLLMSEPGLSMEDAFAVTRIVQEKDPSYRYCHVLGHSLSAAEVKKDPSRWKDVVTRCPSGTCSNGCVHGAFQESFRMESLSAQEIEDRKPELSTMCEKQKGGRSTELEKSTCYHAMGHLVMYLTQADIRKSLDLCRELGRKPGADYTKLCFDGAFMQIFQPLEPEDFALIEGKEVSREDFEMFCKGFPSKERASCWTEGWPLLLPEIKSPERVIAHCRSGAPEWEAQCYRALTYVLTAQFNLDADKIFAFCSKLPGDRRGMCFGNAASRLLETDYRNREEAVDLCMRGAPFDPNGLCFNELVFFSSYNFIPSSKEALALCELLPPPWQNACLAQTRLKIDLFK